MGIVFIDLKKHLILWITKSSAISLPPMVCSTVNCPGLNPILQIVNNSAVLMTLNQRQRKLKLECHRVHALVFYSSSFISMISHLLSKIVMSPMYADDISLCYQSNVMTSRNSIVGYKAANFL